MSRSIYWIVPSAIVAATTPCYAVQYLNLEEAQKACFPQGGSFHPHEVNMSPEQMKSIKESTDTEISPETKVWKVTKEGKVVGWFMVDQVIGKHENITYALAIDASGKVKSIEVMDYRESYGFQIRNADWRQQFVGKTVDSKLKLNSDIRNISGATLSCRHVTEGVKKLMMFYDVALKNG